MPITDRKKREYLDVVSKLAGRLESHAAYVNPFPVDTYTLYRTFLPEDHVHMFERLQPKYPDIVLGSQFLPVKLYKSWEFDHVPMLMTEPGYYLSVTVKFVLSTKPGDPEMMTGLRLWHKPWKEGIAGAYASELLHVLGSGNEHYEAIVSWALNVVQHTLARLVVVSAAEQLFKECQTEAQINTIWPNATKVLGWGMMAKVGKTKGRVGHIPKPLRERLEKALPMIDEYLARAALMPARTAGDKQVVHVIVSRAVNKRG